MTRQSIRQVGSKFFLSIAFIFITLQWLWVLALGLPQLIEIGVFDSLTPPPAQPSASQASEGLSPVLAIVAGVVTLVFIVITVIILIKLPKTISTTGQKIVHQTTEVILPVITHHNKIPAKKKRLVSKRITTTLQALLILLPLVISLFIPSTQAITSQIILTLAVWLAGISLVCFIISWLLEPKTTSRTQSHASRG